MPTIDLWFQLENHAWDVSPTSNVDRITGETINVSPQPRTLTSPVTGVSTTRTMNKPLADDALIIRRYTENWAAPADRKVNPWDINEPDPTDSGTMGTVPGPVIECNVGDTVRVHFRNMDQRSRLVTRTITIPLPFGNDIEIPIPAQEPLPVERRAHSLHPHGFVFAPTFDGAYPLSPPDPSQPIDPAETTAWDELGVTGLKQGDRVPPGGTFTYTWETLGWPTTAGVWLYHDHSICDMDNVNAGAIGIIVIHNTADTENEVEITPERLPGGSFTGSPVQLRCFPFAEDFELPTLPHDLLRLGDLRLGQTAGHHGAGLLGDPAPALGLDTGLEELLPSHGPPHGHEVDAKAAGKARRGKGGAKHGPGAHEETEQEGEEEPPLAVERAIRRGDMIFELDEKLARIIRLCIRRYRAPPDQGLYLQLLHEMPGMGMVINGRKYMGNTPTIVAGPNTRMRFGVVGMGNAFHTFHLHGHRWIIPGPVGMTPTDIQNSPQVQPVSQFEDTRIFGPANSFVFTIEEGGGFMRASPAIGEWHMHCHVLGHMMDGMMGSLLVVNGGEPVTPLPMGTHCPPLSPEEGDHGGMDGGMGPKTWDVNITGFAFSPGTVTVKVGDTVKWTNNDTVIHTVTAEGGAFDSGVFNPVATGPPPTSFSRTFTSAGTFPYRCNVHPAMTGTVVVQT
jgi:plastocyanin